MLYSQRMQCWVFLSLSIFLPLSLLSLCHLSSFSLFISILSSTFSSFTSLESQITRMLKTEATLGDQESNPLLLKIQVHPQATKWKEGRRQGVHSCWCLLRLSPLQCLVSTIDLILRGRRAWQSSALFAVPRVGHSL